MWILNSRRKGFTLVEVVASIAVFMIFIGTITFILNNISVNKSYKDKTRDYIIYMEAFKNKVCGNCSSEEIEYFQMNKMYYINSANIDIEKLKQKNLNQLIDAYGQSNYPYVEIRITNDTVYKFTLKLHFIINNKEKLIDYYFVKGKY